MGSSTKTMWVRRNSLPEVDTPPPIPKKKLIWPNLIVCTEKSVYCVKNKQVKKILSHDYDEGYYASTWTNADLYIAARHGIYKFFKTLEKPYRRGLEPELFVKQMHARSPVVYVETHEHGVREYLIGLELNRVKSKKVNSLAPIFNKVGGFEVKYDGTKLLLLDAALQTIEDAIDLEEQINEVRTMEGFPINV